LNPVTQVLIKELQGFGKVLLNFSDVHEADRLLDI